MSEHKHPNYKKIYFTLLGLLVISVVGPFFGIVWVTLITAFGIALVKANLVIQNFMHLNVERGIVKWMLATSVVLMFLLFAGVAPDVMKHEGTGWVNVAAKEATARGLTDSHGETDEHEEASAAAEHEDDPPLVDGGAEADVAAASGGFDARTAYNTTCALCHGEAGDGSGPGGAALTPKPSNFTDPAFWAERDDERIFVAIKEGAAAVGGSPLMVGWKSSYDDEEILALVEYLKTFRQE